MLQGLGRLREPVIIESVDLLRIGTRGLVRIRSRHGDTGLAATTKRIQYLQDFFVQRVAPYFVGKDARDAAGLIDGVHLHQSNYKLVGLPFWSCVAWVEFALLDLLARRCGVPGHALLGTSLRTDIPVYLSLLGRELTPAQVVDRLQAKLAETGARAVKVKIGGRMREDGGDSAGRTRELVPLLRRELGDGIAIFVDANGSYSAERAIEIGHMLEAHQVGFFEEPCPFERYGDTRRVAEALEIPVAGGEQDSSSARWEEIIGERVVDIAQPDLVYNGGFMRTLRVAALAEAGRIPVSLHNPHGAPTSGYMLHLAAVLPGSAPFHEWNVMQRREPWCKPALVVRNGVVPLPTSPGLAPRIDLLALRRSELVQRVRQAGRRVFGPLVGRRSG